MHGTIATPTLATNSPITPHYIAPATGTDVCVCGDICTCYAGIPTGDAFIALIREGIADKLKAIAEHEHDKKYSKVVAALRTQVRRGRLMVMHHELKAAMREELAA